MRNSHGKKPNLDHVDEQFRVLSNSLSSKPNMAGLFKWFSNYAMLVRSVFVMDNPLIRIFPSEFSATVF